MEDLTMKKTYQMPTMLIVTLQHTTQLMVESLGTEVGGNADFNYAGGRGASDLDYSEGRVKEHSLWDEDW